MLAGGCGASSGGNTPKQSGNEAGMGTGGADDAPTLFPPDVDNDGGGDLVHLNPLCGVGTVAGTCVPDNPTACSTYEPPAEASGGAGGEGGVETSAAGQGGQLASGGAGNATSAGGEGGQAVVPGAAGAAESGGANAAAGGAGGAPVAGAGGYGGDGSATTPASFSCQVTRENNDRARRCVAAGTGATNAPCFTAADCAAGLACVTEGDAGRCLPYCCDPTSACAPGAYCAERALRKNPTDTSRAEPPHVPVCVPADNCSLEERFPCPVGSDCRCKNGTACMVVRNDGTTTCLEPGSGEQGADCPCAWNHVCSSVTGTCIKICHTDPTKDECGVQKCQASSELPKNFGVCVGPQ
jgi:hypothetical protein